MGSTGFLGKVLIEKLLRSCPDISTIYLLIRTKKDKCPETRLDEIFQIPLYNLLKKEMPDFRKKIVPIVGDLNIENFGLSEADKNILINKVSIIFHVAANVRFNESIKVSTIINVSSVDTILKIAKCMPNLKSLIHVSTAYANCYVKYVEERFYTYPINYKELNTLIHTLPENVFEKKIAKIISQWPNTYTFTKAIAEGLIRDESEDLPIGIFRPSIVLSSANEPFGGWIDNTYGPIGILLSSLLGIATFLYSFKHVRADVVPVDFTVNALIVSAYDVFNQHRRGKDMLIYNFVSPVDGPTWNNYKNKLFVVNKIYPLHSAKWFPKGLIIQNKVLYNICTFFGHFLPALFIDAATICIKRKPKYA
ncbi:putative fatty acyl-CoA reductase CG5065 [Pogonomyrmex barbatus]|uniref:Fatty acyl-CoA reductase n=1 Tax=Pogonomyrmex barbatus TaxID=144034 RepID=A0A8N1S244_9HYME|nr:putative fatty acyl-CoA reductase CG5065 [Pogonomyrmex barbatus]